MPRSDRFQDFSARLQQKSLAIPANADRESSDWKIGVRNAADDVVEILLHDYIGDDWSGTDSATLAATVKAASGKRIVLDINSFGGSAYDGIAIYNALAMHDSQVEANITGVAYSAASYIPLAADIVRIAENGTFGIHPASLGVWGNRFDLDHYSGWLLKLDQQIMDTYVARTGLSATQIEQWFIGENKDGTFFNGKEAVQHGFADELLPLKKGRASSAAASADKPDDKLKVFSRQQILDRVSDLKRKHTARLRAERLAAMQKQIDETAGAAG